MGLKWQKGKQPEDGWYWQSFLHKWENEEWWDGPEPSYLNEHKRNERSKWINYKWAGPIPEPEKE